MKTNGHVIKAVDPGSIAEALELAPGDRVLAINGREIEDIFDYQYQVNSKQLVMLVEKTDGDQWELEIENDYQDLGITFENGLMSDYRSCTNKCIFCFIDQMPPGMRETLYFKDDDSRLSFLQGNYVTLTNMKDHDIRRIIDFKLAPINISVHTTNPELRCRMLHNRFAGEALKKIDTLYEAGIPMNGQIVLCRGINDGAELDRTIGDLARYLPCMESVSVVPVGLSKFRDGLYPLEPFDKAAAESALEIIEGWQEKLYAEHGVHFIHASDEFYILAERDLPEEERYDGYPQLENGVGMLRLLDTEVDEALDVIDEEFEGEADPERLTIATGLLAAPYLEKQAAKIMERHPKIRIQVIPIRNEFFGELITVAGLITGQDLIKQLSGRDLGDRLLLPVCMFRSGEETFLDDRTREDVQTALQVPVDIVKSSGQDLVDAVLGLIEEEDTDYEGYELKEIYYE
ncbi:MAG TPA: DUF512 domain-containing protein [Candidatus Ventrimonas merdavium]|nr:DUF512 domain-containing protein [Candidatus Ventrimonas merdavium]